jgi:hypothetical protein
VETFRLSSGVFLGIGEGLLTGEAKLVEHS